jgi:hypothetical protein
MYNFADSSVTASAFTSGANTALTLVATTSGLTTTAALVIYYDDQVASNSVTGTVELGPTSLNALESITVTMGQVTVTGGLTDTQLRASAVTIGGTVTVGNSITIGQITSLQGQNLLGSQGVFSTLRIRDTEGSYGEPVGSGTNTYNLPVYGTVTVGNSVTIGSLPAISGTVTANNTNLNRLVQDGEFTDTFGVPIIYARVAGGALDYWQEVSQISGLPVKNQLTTGGDTVPFTVSGSVTIGAGTAQIGSVTASISGTVPISISSVTVGNSVTIGSLPAISGTVTANLAISSTAITSGSFTSLTSATLVPANTARKMATVYNLGAGQLFVNAGVTATTLGGGFMVALSSGDYFECPFTTTTLSAIFATAGTASWMSH